MTTIAGGDDRWTARTGSQSSWAAAPHRRGRYARQAHADKQQAEAGAAVAKYGAHAGPDLIRDLSALVYKALDASTTDFRLRDSLAREFNVDSADVDAAIKLLGDKVRRPVSSDGRYDDWYRLTARGLTKRERWRRFRALVGKTSYN